MLQKCENKMNLTSEMLQARSWGCALCPALLAGSSLLLCACAWQSRGGEGAPVLLQMAETVEPFSSVSPQEASLPPWVCVEGKVCKGSE